MKFSFDTIAYVFGASEVMLLLVKRSKKSAVKNQTDKRSLIILWITITATMTLGGFIALRGTWPVNGRETVLYAGLGVAVVGFIIRWSAILQLGKMFTVDVAIVSEHKLKTNGLYKIVRHPSYLGLMLIICGIALCQADILSYIIIIIPTFLALNYRMVVEEHTLTAEFGEQYKAYKKRTARILPGVY